ncbi:MAG: plasmid stabilization protein [Alphaproteobacteria bacterium]|nr:MAG: plasmid stabilization protein [Alphaproteobacteria bacterium]
MATLTIRNVDPALKEILRVRAAQKGRSMEAELRAILQAELAGGTRAGQGGLASAIHRRFAPLGGVDLPDFEDEPVREPPDFK